MRSLNTCRSVEKHGKVKFGSLMGALKLVRTSSKLAHFDA